MLVLKPVACVKETLAPPLLDNCAKPQVMSSTATFKILALCNINPTSSPLVSALPHPTPIGKKNKHHFRMFYSNS